LHVEMSGLVVSDAMMMMVMGLMMAMQDAQLLYITIAVMAKAEN
jgi:multisubunit Na+/H+ antiporter MnhC subunit